MAIEKLTNKNGSVRYRAKVRDALGQWYQSACFHHEEDARTEEARLRQLKRKGERAISGDARLVTVSDFWEVWSFENRPNVSEGWKISQNQMFRDYIAPVIGELKMIEVDAPEVGKIFKRAKDKGIGDQTRKHIYSLVRKLFSDAVEYYEMLRVSPVKPKFHRPSVREKKRDFLLPEQAWRLLDFSRGHYLGPAIWLQTLSALRPSEAQALTWGSVQFEQGQLLICSAFNNKTGLLQAYPKQEDWAYVPMPKVLQDYLAARRGANEAFVCQGIRGGMLSYETYLRALKRLCLKAGVPAVTPHELRHSCTELWVQAGASAEDIRRLLNHHSLSATRHYIHRTDERLAALSGKVSQMSQDMFQIWDKEAFAMPSERAANVH